MQKWFLVYSVFELLFGEQLACHAAVSKYFYICTLSNKPFLTFNSTAKEDGSFSYTRVGTRRLRASNNTISNDSGLNSKKFDGAELVDTNDFRFSNERPAIRLMHTDDDSDKRISPSGYAPGSSFMIKVRECPCVPHVAYGTQRSFYCDSDQGYCAIEGSYTGSTEPVCLNIQNEEIFVRSVWPIILIWFALTLTFCACTWAGRNATDFMISLCFPAWNRYIFEALCDESQTQQEAAQTRRNQGSANDGNNSSRELNQNEEGTRRRSGSESRRRNNSRSCLQSMIYRRRVNFQNRYSGIVLRARMREEGVTPTASGGGFEYELPTRRFKSDKEAMKSEATAQLRGQTVVDTGYSLNGPDGVEDDEEEDLACAICFLAFQDGDRVTETECNHTFHVACLKDWLTRRNVCPLCMQEGVAKPKGVLRSVPEPVVEA